MNVDDITRQVCGLLDFDPEEPKYARLVLSYVNSVYQGIFASKPYTFAMAEAEVALLPDDTTGTVTVTSGSRVVTGVGTLWGARHEGAWIYLPDAQWYRVALVNSTLQILLHLPYQGANAVGATFTLRQRYVAMPRDIVDYHGFTCRDANRREIRFLSPAEEQHYVLTDEDSGPPSLVTDAPPWSPRTPNVAPTLTVVTGVGSLVPGRTYRYCVTHRLAGVESGPSLIAEVTIPSAAGNYSVRITSMEASLAAPQTVQIYRADGSDASLYFLTGVRAVAAYDDDGASTDPEYPLVDEANHVYVRFWPRPTESETVTVRYHFRPRKLLKPSDVPELPTHHHEALVWGAALRLFKKNGDDVGVRLAQGMLKEKMDEIEARHLTRVQDIAVRQVQTFGVGPVYNIGPIVKV